MSPAALHSAVEMASDVARQLLDAQISEQDAAWIVTTALIVEALKRACGNKTRAARMLGMNRNSLKQQIRERHLIDFAVDLRDLADLQMPLFDRKRPASSVQMPGKSRGAAA